MCSRQPPPCLGALPLLVAFVLFLDSCAPVDQVPEWVVWHEGKVTGMSLEVSLARRRAVVIRDGAELCRTPDDWSIQDLIVADLDRDEAEELVLLCWNKQTFGSSRPFWLEEEPRDNKWTQHIYVMRPEKDLLRPVWMASDVGAEVQEIRKTGNLIELVERDGGKTSWRWDSWGLVLVEEHEGDASEPSGDARTLSILVTGDIVCHEGMFAAACARRGTDGQPTFDFLFEHLHSFVERQDISVCCQETVLVEDISRVSFYPLFATPQSMGDAIANAGYDVVCAATNHAADLGARGVAETLSFWTEHHPDVRLLGMHGSADDGAIAYMERKGFTLAFMNATDRLNGLALEEGASCTIDTLDDLDDLLDQVEEAEERADLTICILHIGDEYSAGPSSRQRDVVKRFVDAGADAVICSHAHVPQRCQRVRTGMGRTALVYWSLGNLVSNQMRLSTIVGEAACLTIGVNETGETCIQDHAIIPTVCHIEPSVTCAYLLDDYTGELMLRHEVVRNYLGDAM